MLQRAVMSICAVAGLAAAASGQQVIAYWHFPTTVPSSSVNFQINFPLAADSAFNAGTNQITTDATVWNGVPAPANDVGQGAFQYFTGSTINAQGGDVAGAGLGMRGLTGLLSNGKSMTFQINTTGFFDIVMAYAERVTTTGPSVIDVSTSIDGINFSPATALAPTRDGTFRLRTIDLSAIDSIENVSAAYIRLTVSGISNASGGLRIDNVTFVPAPGAAAFGLALVGFAARRRR